MADPEIDVVRIAYTQIFEVKVVVITVLRKYDTITTLRDHRHRSIVAESILTMNA